MVGESQELHPVAEGSDDGEVKACGSGLKSWRWWPRNVNCLPEETMRARNVLCVFVDMVRRTVNTETTDICSKFNPRVR